MPLVLASSEPPLVLHGHRVGVHSLLAADAFETGKDTPVFILVALHGQATLLVAGSPGEAHEVLLRFAEGKCNGHVCRCRQQ